MPAPPTLADDPAIRRMVAALAARPPARLCEPARWRAAGDAPGRRPRRTVVLRVGIAAAGLGCAAAVVLALLPSSSGGPAEALAIFSRPAVDASHIRPDTPILARAAADYDEARAFSTPSGTGYVVPAGDKLCIAWPGASGWAESCGALDDVERYGLVAGMWSPTGETGEIVALLPDSATDVAVAGPGDDATPVTAVDGVVVLPISHPVAGARFTYIAGGREGGMPLAGPPAPAAGAGVAASTQTTVAPPPPASLQAFCDANPGACDSTPPTTTPPAPALGDSTVAAGPPPDSTPTITATEVTTVPGTAVPPPMVPAEGRTVTTNTPVGP